MENSNNLIEKKLRDSYFKTYHNSRNLRLPSLIDFITEDTNIVRMKLSANSVCKNLQNDDAAFEAWSLALKSFCICEKIIVEWEKPLNIKDGHYQRFLFRVNCFKDDFNSWFSISPKCIDYFIDSQITSENDYFLNQPGKRNEISNDRKGEADLELKFINPLNPLNKSLIHVTNLSFIERQLPVGLFKNSVSSLNRIFTGGKSAVDLWGLNKDEDALFLFELKTEKNSKAGIISELYFYSSIFRFLKEGRFKYEYKDLLSEKIKNIKLIKSYFLAPALHPIVCKKLLDEINLGVPDTIFGYINIDGDKVTIKM